MSSHLLQLAPDLRRSEQDSVLQLPGGGHRGVLRQIPGRHILLTMRLAYSRLLFQAAGSVSMYCPLRREMMDSALARGRDQSAASMKQCERADAAPAVVTLCHGAGECEVRADPRALNTTQCNDQHVALKIAFACMNKVRRGDMVDMMDIK